MKILVSGAGIESTREDLVRIPAGTLPDTALIRCTGEHSS